MKRLGIMVIVAVAVTFLCADIASAGCFGRLRARHARCCCIPVTCCDQSSGVVDTESTTVQNPDDDEPTAIDPSDSSTQDELQPVNPDDLETPPEDMETPPVDMEDSSSDTETPPPLE